jgi:acyl-CoA synthetase (AMP-forming)/AMP-acid ligase II/acyl carrier protein
VSTKELTFFDVIVSHAARDPDRAAIVSLGSKPLSYEKLVGQIKIISDTLRDGGVGHGSQVAIALPSGRESVISTVAIASCATCVPLNPHLSQNEFERELSRSRLDALVVPEWMDSPVRAAAESGSYALFEAAKSSRSPSGFEMRRIRPATRPQDGLQEISSRSAVLLLRTSGTTGTVKLVPVTHANMLDLASKMAGWFGLGPEDRAACLLSTYYAAGSKLNTLLPLMLGGSIAIPTGVRPERLSEWVYELRPTWFSAGPTLLLAILDELRSMRDLSLKGVLRFITSGSAHLPDRVRTDLEGLLDCPVLEVYGLTEAGVMAANPAPPAKRKPGTAGLIATRELVIRGPTGASLSAGEVGEIFVGGPALMPGYGDGRTPGEGLQDSWLRTGDLGFVDHDGFLTLVGRTNEIINRGGEKIAPNDVEKALLLHPCVREAAAFGVPHARLGENVAAAVTLQPGASTTPLELKAFLRSQLASFKIPQRIDIVPSLAKSHRGKVLKAELAKTVADNPHRIELPETFLEQQILDIWQKLLQRADIGIDDDFFEAGGDSLLATQMLLEVEALLGHRISKSDVADASTIRQLAAIPVVDARGSDEIVMNVKKGSKRPFFFCHGDFETHGFYALKLAKLLAPDVPVYLIHPLLDVAEKSKLAMEDMARVCVPRLLALQPHGSFRLGGYCNGGLLAWEIAHQLRHSGREVETVVLVESLSLNSRPLLRAMCKVIKILAPYSSKKGFDHLLGPHRMSALWWWTRKAQGSIYRCMIVAFQAFIGRLQRANKQDQPSASRLQHDLAIIHLAMANYIPPKIDSEIIAVVCERNANLFEWSSEPWAKLAPVVRPIIIPGEHGTCVTTHVETLAKTLNEHLGI